MKPSLTGLADAVLAFDALKPKPTGGALDALLSMCGLERAIDGSIETSLGDPPDPDDDNSALAGTDLPHDRRLSRDELPPSVQQLTPIETGDPLAGDRVDPLDSAIAVRASPFSEIFSLLDPGEEADIVRAAASLPTPTAHVDVEATIATLAAARPIDAVPRLTIPALVGGLHVLVDVGEPMEPFEEDQQNLVGRLDRLVGGTIEIKYFADDPWLGAGPQRRRRSWRPYALPSCGQPVLLLSDIGCGFPGRPHTTEATTTLSDRLHRRGNRLVILAPVRTDRVPKAVNRHAKVIIWDRGRGRRQSAELRRLRDDN